MPPIWQQDGSGWRLLAPTGFPAEAALHTLVERAPHILPLAGGPRLTILGREVGLSFYRSRRDDPMLIQTPGVGPANATLVSFRSLQVELPILEYRPFRSFALDQSSSLVIQFYAGFDTPLQSSVVSPEGAPKPGLRTVGLGGIRVVFDWRYYLQ